MTTTQTYHAYIERYGNIEGTHLFGEYAYFCIQTGVSTKDEMIRDINAVSEGLPFPTCLIVCDVIRQIREI